MAEPREDDLQVQFALDLIEKKAYPDVSELSVEAALAPSIDDCSAGSLL